MYTKNVSCIHYVIQVPEMINDLGVAQVFLQGTYKFREVRICYG